MGCSTSSRVIVEEPSSKNPHHGTEANKQVKKEASLGTRGIISGRGSGIEDDSHEGRLPEDCTQQMPSVKGENNEQNIDIRDGLPMKKVSLPESERQTSADILEELRMQGIIKTPGATSKNRITDDTMTREEQAEKELLVDKSSPIISHESRATGNEIDWSTPVVKNVSPFQSLNNLRTGSWMEKEEVDDNVNSLEDFSVVESDVTFNTTDEVF